MFSFFRRRQKAKEVQSRARDSQSELEAQPAPPMATGSFVAAGAAPGGAAPAPPPAPITRESVEFSARTPSSHKIKAASAKEKLSTLGGQNQIGDKDKEIIEAMRKGKSLPELMALRARLHAEKG